MKIGKALFIASFVLGSSIADAQSTTDLGVVLWGSLKAGMTKDDVKKVQPSKKVTLNDHCSAELSYGFEAKRLNAVAMISSSGAPADCTVLLLKSLMTKYGDKPFESSSFTQGNCGGYGSALAANLAQLCRAMGGEKLVEHSYYIWQRDGVIVRAEVTDKDTSWNVIYIADPKVTQDTLKNF